MLSDKLAAAKKEKNIFTVRSLTFSARPLPKRKSVPGTLFSSLLYYTTFCVYKIAERVISEFLFLPHHKTPSSYGQTYL